MNSQTRVLGYIPIKNSVQQLKVTVYYHKGGQNYFTYKEEPRGLFLSVTPVERCENFEKVTAFSGIKKCVKEMPRFNSGVLWGYVPTYEELKQLVIHVAVKGGFNVNIPKEMYAAEGVSQ